MSGIAAASRASAGGRRGRSTATTLVAIEDRRTGERRECESLIGDDEFAAEREDEGRECGG